MANSSPFFRDTIVCSVELFKETMPVVVYTNNQIEMSAIPADDAGITLIGLCKTYDIDLIQLRGDANYLQGLESEIRDAERVAFAEQEHDLIEIQVNPLI